MAISAARLIFLVARPVDCDTLEKGGTDDILIDVESSPVMSECDHFLVPEVVGGPVQRMDSEDKA